LAKADQAFRYRTDERRWVRVVRQGPGGLIYVGVDEGKFVRLRPRQPPSRSANGRRSHEEPLHPVRHVALVRGARLESHFTNR